MNSSLCPGPLASACSGFSGSGEEEWCPSSKTTDCLLLRSTVADFFRTPLSGRGITGGSPVQENGIYIAD